jgi:uncharacterized protein
MDFGIEQVVWTEISSVFSHYPEINRALLFGSRAMGTFRSNSDIDLVLFCDSPGLKFSRFLDIKAELEDLGMLYKIDLLDFDRIDNDELKDYILRVGREIYNSSQKSLHKKNLQN